MLYIHPLTHSSIRQTVRTIVFNQVSNHTSKALVFYLSHWLCIIF